MKTLRISDEPHRKMIVHALESCRNVFARVLMGERVMLLGFRMVHA
jgi:hypothetical protein